jgi:bifunctional DNA-binding transcriptional regulator/antitoxin component of YhaV-PrlF toxin-antitoxin module
VDICKPPGIDRSLTSLCVSDIVKSVGYLANRKAMASVTKITAKYQVTLPREVRQALKAKIGDLLVFVRQADGTFRVRSVPPRLTHALRLAGKDLSPDDFRRVHKEFEEGWER